MWEHPASCEQGGSENRAPFGRMALVRGEHGFMPNTGRMAHPRPEAANMLKMKFNIY